MSLTPSELNVAPAFQAASNIASSMTSSAFSSIQQALDSPSPDVTALMQQVQEMRVMQQVEARRRALLENRVEVEAALACRPNSGLPARSATCVQAVWRRHVAISFANLTRTVQAVVRVQAFWRCVAAKRNLQKVQQSATKLASVARGRLQRRTISEHIYAATRVQASFRGYRTRTLRTVTRTALISEFMHFGQRITIEHTMIKAQVTELEAEVSELKSALSLKDKKLKEHQRRYCSRSTFPDKCHQWLYGLGNNGESRWHVCRGCQVRAIGYSCSSCGLCSTCLTSA